MALNQVLIHVRTAYIFIPTAIICNAIVWVTCSGIWRLLRKGKPQTSSQRYALSFAATGLIFIVANTAHVLRPVWCADCFFPYGIPFTFFRLGGFAGGGGVVLSGIAADLLVIMSTGVILGGLWQWFSGHGMPLAKRVRG